MNKTLDLAKGNIWKLLARFSIPCVLSLLITPLYSFVDQIYIGNSSIGTFGRAAIGITLPLIIFAQAFSYGIGDGCGAYLSLSSGKGDGNKAKKAIGTGIYLTLIISVILTVLGLIFSKSFLRLFGASNNTIGYANSYYIILVSFLPIFMLENALVPIIRNDGSPIYSIISLGIGALLNIALDPLFIYAFKLGIQGAAWSSVISQSIAFIFVAIYFLRPKTFDKDFLKHFSLKEFKEPLLLGLSSFIVQMAIVAMTLACNYSVTKYGNLSKYGADTALSAMAVECNIFTVIINLSLGIALGAQPIFSFAKGKGDFERIKKTYFAVLIITALLMVVFTLVDEIYPDAFIRPFGAGSALYMEYARKIFRIFLALSVLTSFIKSTVVFLQATDHPILAMGISMFRDLVCFIPFVLIFPLIMEKNQSGAGIDALLFAAPAADILATIGALIITIKVFKENERPQSLS